MLPELEQLVDQLVAVVLELEFVAAAVLGLALLLLVVLLHLLHLLVAHPLPLVVGPALEVVLGLVVLAPNLQ